MSRTSDMSGATELMSQAGQVLELPMLAFHQASAVLTGGSLFTKFEVARSEAYCGQDVENELNRVGVSSTGRGFVPGSEQYPYGLHILYVKASQRRWAEYALRRCTGFDVITVVDVRNAEWPERHDGPIPAWSGRASKMGTVARSVGLAGTSPSTKREPKRGRVSRLLDWLTGEDEHER